MNYSEASPASNIMAILPETDYFELFLWLLRKRKRLRISGNSMLPLLKPGEEILVDCCAYNRSSPKIGELVVTQHPYHSDIKIIKRVAAIDQHDNCYLIGDNPAESSDSRHWGTVNSKDILGKVTSRFS